MANTTTVDDQAGGTLAPAFGAGWVQFSNRTGTAAATQWYNGTYTECAAQAWSQPECLVTVSFEGSNGAFYGDASSTHGRFFCALAIGDVIQERYWYNGGSIATWGLNHVLCSVTGLQEGTYRLVLGQVEDDCGADGISMDYYTFGPGSDDGTPVAWTSDFAVDAANPAYANSTSNSTVAALSSSTLGSTSSVASAQPTTAPQNKSSSSDTTALGAGLGAGIGSALVLAGLAFYFLRRWRSARSAGSYNDNQSGTQPSPISYAPSAGWASYNGTGSPYASYVPELQTVSRSDGVPSSLARKTSVIGLEDPEMFQSR